MADEHQVRVPVLGQNAVQAAHGHVGKEAPVRAQRHGQRLGQREDLGRLHRPHQRTRQDEAHARHARLERGKVGVGLFPGLGGERARRVVQALWNLRIRVSVSHQENLHHRLQPESFPLPSVVHERARQGKPWEPLAVSFLLALCSAGCQTKQAPPTVRDAGTVARGAPMQDAGPYLLTAAKLDAFLEYKRALLTGGEPSAAQLRELLRAVDAGEPEAVDRAWAFLKAQGTLEAAARTRAGLSPAEVRTIESMAADVAAARLFAKPVGLGKLSDDLAAARNSLPPERRAAVDTTLAALREDEARVERLADEREAWGDANVDLLLTKEKELVRLYEAQVRGARERLGLGADGGL